MLVVPAIDIKDSKVVRLTQGKFQEIVVYSSDPVSVAKKWQAQGAEFLHIVDLDGAVSGEIKNIQIIEEITKEVNIPAQLGGGIRDRDTIKRLFEKGIWKAVLATRVLKDKNFLKDIILEFSDKIVVSIDSCYGKIGTSGWTKLLSLEVNTLAHEIESGGVKTIIYTDISRDGTLSGPNIEAIKQILETVNIGVFASGGISSLEDIKNLRKLQKDGLIGIIVGKALYEERFSLEEAIRVAQ